jgi:hypothetical protein
MGELQLSDLPGKVILVGITYYTHDRQFIEQKQYHGTVIRADDTGIVVQKSNGEEVWMPPDLRSTKPAPPGEYRERSTGEIVVNPDFFTTWKVVKDPPKD